jgi:fatty-acyl-CoA synthase
MPIDRIVRTPSAYDDSLLIKRLLRTPLAHAPDQEIVFGESMRHTYRTLRERIGRLGSALTRLGVQAGDTVAVMDWDSHRYLECYFAIPMIGAVLQTVNIRLSPEQVLYCLQHAGASVVLVNTEFLPLLESLRAQLPQVRTLVLLDDTKSAPATSLAFAGEYERLLADADPGFEFPDFDENARATTFYTTGTTGLPKGVYYSHRQIVLHTLAVAAALGMSATAGRLHNDDVYMPITPMFHVHAWGLPYVCTMMGVKQVYPGRYVPDLLMRLKRRERVTFSHCVPTILQMLLASKEAQETDLAGWKVVIGGSALPDALARAALARGIDLIGGYGMSETGPVLVLAQPTTKRLADPETERATRCMAGRVIPLVDLRVVDAEMRELPHDGASAGEVVVRAPWLTQGYHANPEASEQLWAGGWLHTNDIGHVDADGYLKITDRIKDVIKTGGEWVSSLQLEDLIARHPSVGEVAVIGVKDERWGERPLALVVPKPGASADADAIRTHLTRYADDGTISKYAVPERIRFVDAIDKTSVGKLDKKALRAKYGA